MSATSQWGRFYELTGSRPKLSTGNAENWSPQRCGRLRAFPDAEARRGREWGDVKERVDALGTAASEIKVGDTVTVNPGATDYNGGKLSAFVYKTRYIVQELKSDRAVIGLDGKVTAAVNVKDLTLA